MATLNESNGSDNALRGVMPSMPEERDGRHHWLVFETTNIWAVHTTSMDLARALVLDRLGYGHRPELAERLDARPATQGEISAVCTRRRQRPLKVQPSTATRLGKLARLIYLDDLKHDRVEPPAHERQGSAASKRGRNRVTS